ncbi:hypothetical protein ENBRE01_0079 [Enteropsectra breve]|nr:hypothetical protein ENBRE01_0079 [Enteropsectra breve]
MIERSARKRIKLYVLDNRTRETLDQIIGENVSNDSIVNIDGWKGYNGMRFIFKRHGTVNHSLYYKDPTTGVHTNTIEGSWLGVKMHIPPRERTKDKVQLYLVRYMLIKNAIGHPFLELLKYLF